MSVYYHKVLHPPRHSPPDLRDSAAELPLTVQLRLLLRNSPRTRPGLQRENYYVSR